jgi:hypothetical protein
MSDPNDGPSRPAIAVRAHSAFPPDLEESVNAALTVIGESRLNPTGPGIGHDALLVGGSFVGIPRRIYSAEPSPGSADSLPDDARLVLACFYTRHHDGRVRQRWLPPLLQSTEPWVPPFVIQLLGEYVVQIADLIVQSLPDLDAAAYRRFAAANPPFLDLTCRRVVSYWACYYRNRYRFADYPNFHALNTLGLWVKHVGVPQSRPAGA